jgi:hypothetical protein
MTLPALQQRREKRDDEWSISLFEQVAYLPLLHKLVEERAGERRFATFYVVSLSPLARGEGTKQFAYRDPAKK